MLTTKELLQRAMQSIAGLTKDPKSGLRLFGPAPDAAQEVPIERWSRMNLSIAGDMIFGGTFARPHLSLANRVLCCMSVEAVRGYYPHMVRYTRWALNNGLTPAQLMELIPLLGFVVGFPPIEFEAFAPMRDVFKEKPEWEAAIPKEGFAHRPVDMEEWARKGKEMKQRLWGAEAGTVDAAAHALAPDFMELADAYLFGGVYQRPGLDVKQRMYCVIAALTALGNEPQLRRYIKAALRVGVTHQEVVEVLVQCSGYAGLSAAVNALATAKAIFDEKKG